MVEQEIRYKACTRPRYDTEDKTWLESIYMDGLKPHRNQDLDFHVKGLYASLSLSQRVIISYPPKRALLIFSGISF